MPSDKNRVQAFLDDETFAALKSCAENNDLSVSSTVVQLLRQALGLSETKSESPLDSLSEDKVKSMIAESLSTVADTENKIVDQQIEDLKRRLNAVEKQLSNERLEQPESSVEMNAQDLDLEETIKAVFSQYLQDELDGKHRTHELAPTALELKFRILANKGLELLEKSLVNLQLEMIEEFKQIEQKIVMLNDKIETDFSARQAFSEVHQILETELSRPKPFSRKKPKGFG